MTIDLGPYIPDKEKLRAALYNKQSPDGAERSKERKKKNTKSSSKRGDILDSYLKGHPRGLLASTESIELLTAASQNNTTTVLSRNV